MIFKSKEKNPVYSQRQQGEETQKCLEPAWATLMLGGGQYIWGVMWHAGDIMELGM